MLRDKNLPEIQYNFPPLFAFEEQNYPEGYGDITRLITERLNNFLEYNGLTVEDGGRYEWNEKEKCYEFVIKTSGVTSKDHRDFSLEGRNIRIKFKNEAVELLRNSDEHIVRCQQLVKMAENFIGRYRKKDLTASQLEEIEQYKKRLKLPGNYLENIFVTPPPNSRPLDLTNKKERAVADAIVQKEFEKVNKTIEEMEKKNFFEVGGYKKWKKTINLEAEWVSNTQKREVLVAVFANKSSNGSFDSLQCEWCTPLTDVPSPLRKGEGAKIPNTYRVENAIFKRDAGSFKVVEETLQYRSASVPPIKEKNGEKRREKAKKMAENYVRDLALAKLTKYVIDNKDNPTMLTASKIQAVMGVNVAVTSLLSPAADFKFGINAKGIVLGLLTGTLGLLGGYFYERSKDRDTRQVVETENAYRAIHDLKLNRENIDYINKVLIKSGMREIQRKEIIRILKKSTIQPKIIYQNFGTNSGRGLDFTGTEDRIIRKARADFSSAALAKYDEILREGGDKFSCFKETLNAMRDGNMNLAGQGKWNNVKKRFADNLEALHEFIQKNPETSTRERALYRSMSLYYRYIEYTYDPYPTKGIFEKDPRHNFIPAVISDELSKSLGFIPHNNCKSGEDRTGTKQILYNIMLSSSMGEFSDPPLHKVMVDRNHYDRFLDNTWSRFKEVAILSNSRNITGINAPGATGLQLDKANVPSHLREFVVNEKAQATLHKKIYQKYQRPLNRRRYRYMDKALKHVAAIGDRLQGRQKHLLTSAISEERENIRRNSTRQLEPEQVWPHLFFSGEQERPPKLRAKKPNQSHVIDYNNLPLAEVQKRIEALVLEHNMGEKENPSKQINLKVIGFPLEKQGLKFVQDEVEIGTLKRRDDNIVEYELSNIDLNMASIILRAAVEPEIEVSKLEIQQIISPKNFRRLKNI